MLCATTGVGFAAWALTSAQGRGGGGRGMWSWAIPPDRFLNLISGGTYSSYVLILCVHARVCVHRLCMDNALLLGMRLGCLCWSEVQTVKAKQWRLERAGEVWRQRPCIRTCRRWLSKSLERTSLEAKFKICRSEAVLSFSTLWSLF